MKRLLWIACFTYLLIGLTHIIIGSLLTEILDYYNRNYTDGGVLIACQSIGFLTGVICSSYISNFLGRRRAVIFAILSIGLAQIAFVSLIPWTWWLVIAVFCGLGFGIIEPLVGSLIIDAIKDKPAVAFSRLEVFFGLGSLIMPIISGWLASTDLWRYSFLVLGLYAFFIGVIWMKVSFGALDNLMAKSIEQEEHKQAESTPFLGGRYPLFIGFILFFLIYVGTEVSIMNFLPSILISKLGTETFAATLAVTIFWGAIVTGRLAAGYLAEKMNYVRYLMVCCFGTVVFVVSLGFITSLWLGYVFIVLIGLMMAGIFGIALVYANQMLPGSTERNTSILIGAGGVGGIVLPLVTGSIMDQFSTMVVSFVLAGLSLFMFVFILFAKGQRFASEQIKA
ncbi:MFS transporter, FHS family, glucose/mannose:H+ symporter [Gracilibacillus orientalis]|uniref:MFS transporter, FHS family, glucose/mannose:H+ symporter n=1 Tax=Gracilibacillus orientalis TaxID=334253 RepID=A0A1I4LNF1_9BACI|nr:MFS transporter [Gracilibacillus orientalis]SFL92628.1 MFS transporter, FHS family, glucose/mannose:H+ symporter [Gracilibacillus orientalis]